MQKTKGHQRFLATENILLVLLLVLSGGLVPALAQNIYHLATPLKLQPDLTLFEPGDYFVDPACIEEISWPEGLQAGNVDGSGALALEGNILKPVDVMTFVCDGQTYHIPVFQNRRFKHLIRVPASQVNAREVFVFGSFNAWERMATPMFLQDGFWEATVEVDPVDYEYLLLVDGQEMPDPSNPKRVDNGSGGSNSLLALKQRHTLKAPQTKRHTDRKITLEALPNQQWILVFWQNTLVADIDRNNKEISISIPSAARNIERSFLRIFTGDEQTRGRDLLIPLHQGRVLDQSGLLTREDWEAGVMYSLMTDRFFNGNPDNDAPLQDTMVHEKANFFGGDLAGISQKIDEDYFTNLGINIIWLSPVTENPEGAWGLWDKGGVTTKFSGYHGYWPVSNIRPDKRFGTSDELRTLLAKAHSRDINVILDYVANHVHQEHPVYKNHPDWATELYLPDGTLNTERWDDHRLTTWFDTFMPTLDLTRKEVVNPMTDSALVWIQAYGFDGFRHDATKHVDELYWRTLTRKLRQVLAEQGNRRIYQIGETYGSPDLIGSYVSSGMLDAQFDFNLYDALVAALLQDSLGFGRLADVLENSLETYGAHHLMGNISGNHDRPRFISLAGGQVKPNEDTKLAGWTRTIESPEKREAYNKLKMLHAFNFTIPGVPTIYYGDEYGDPGANDPDNRRWMRFDLTDSREADVLNFVKTLINLRTTEPAWIYGTTEWLLEQNGQKLTITRRYFEESIVAIFYLPTRKPKNEVLQFTGNQLLAYSLLEGKRLSKNNKTKVSFRPNPGDVIIYKIKTI
jgi:cyclomaltodextrinase